MKVSAIIITKNEEENLERCLNSLKWVDEIVVVDSGSTDKTIEIARKFDARIYVRNFDNFSSQRNYAAAKAKYDWILSMDADEVIPQSLAIEMQKTLIDPKSEGYLIPRRNIILGAEIKHTRWSPDKHIWLYNKTKGAWTGQIHEEVKVEGQVGQLKNAKVHFSHKNVTEFLTMLNSYTEKEAELKIANGEQFSFSRLLFDPTVSFLGRFLYKKGFLDGLRGFVLSFLMAFYRMVTWMKVWEKQNV